MIKIKSNWRMWVGMALGAGLTLVVVQAQQRASAQPKFTPQDYIDIQQLVVRYADAVDTCSNDGYDYADLYTDDGTYIDLWTDNGIKDGGIRWQGRDKLAEAAGGGVLDCKKNGVMNHLLANHMITPSPEGATGKVYLLWGRGGENPGVVQNQIYKGDWYRDVYVKTPKGWRFKQRTHAREKARQGVFLPGVYPVGDPRAPARR